MEEVVDLLAKNNMKHLELKEKPGAGVYVKDLSTALVDSPEKLMEIMELVALVAYKSYQI